MDMQVKDLAVDIMNPVIYNLDEQRWDVYDSSYNEYYIVQIFADELDGDYCVCIDVSKNPY